MTQILLIYMKCEWFNNTIMILLFLVSLVRLLSDLDLYRMYRWGGAGAQYPLTANFVAQFYYHRHDSECTMSAKSRSPP